MDWGPDVELVVLNWGGEVCCAWELADEVQGKAVIPWRAFHSSWGCTADHVQCLSLDRGFCLYFSDRIMTPAKLKWDTFYSQYSSSACFAFKKKKKKKRRKSVWLWIVLWVKGVGIASFYSLYFFFLCLSAAFCGTSLVRFGHLNSLWWQWWCEWHCWNTAVWAVYSDLIVVTVTVVLLGHSCLSCVQWSDCDGSDSGVVGTQLSELCTVIWLWWQWQWHCWDTAVWAVYSDPIVMAVTVA